MVKWLMAKGGVVDGGWGYLRAMVVAAMGLIDLWPLDQLVV